MSRCAGGVGGACDEAGVVREVAPVAKLLERLVVGCRLRARPRWCASGRRDRFIKLERTCLDAWSDTSSGPDMCREIVANLVLVGERMAAPHDQVEAAVRFAISNEHERMLAAVRDC